GGVFLNREPHPNNLQAPTRDEAKFNPGDRVRVLRTARDYENGWDSVWTCSMNDAIGQEYEMAQHADASGVPLKGRYERLPPFVLERITAETTPLTTKVYKEPPMLKIEQRTLINGSFAEDYSADTLIRKISETESEIARLKEITTKSSAIEKRIAELEDGAKKLAEILDARQ